MKQIKCKVQTIQTQPFFLAMAIKYIFMKYTFIYAYM